MQLSKLVLIPKQAFRQNTVNALGHAGRDTRTVSAGHPPCLPISVLSLATGLITVSFNCLKPHTTHSTFTYVKCYRQLSIDEMMFKNKSRTIQNVQLSQNIYITKTSGISCTSTKDSAVKHLLRNSV